MSWRVIATVIIVIFVSVILWSVTADPVRVVGDSVEDVDDGDGRYDITSQVNSKIRGFSNMFLVLVFGVIGWAMWKVLSRELTRGGL